MKLCFTLLFILSSFIHYGQTKELVIFSMQAKFTIAIDGVVQASDVDGVRIKGVPSGKCQASIFIKGEQFDETIYFNPDEKSTVFELDKNRKDEYDLSYSFEVNVPSWIEDVDFKTEGEKLAAKEVVEKEEVFVSKPVGLVFLHMNNVALGSYWLIIDGVLQNSEPATQIQVNNVPSGYHDVIVVFNGTLMENLGERLSVGNYDLNGFVIEETVTRCKAHPKHFRHYKAIIDKHKNHYEEVKPKVVKVEFQTKNVLLATTDNMRVSRAIYGMEEGKCKEGVKAEKFNKFLSHIESTTMDEYKVSSCKQFSIDNCLTVKQIAQLIALIGFDVDRQEVCLFAYQYCADQANYGNLKASFKGESEFQKMKTELDF
jgi:hypothetical protein